MSDITILPLSTILDQVVKIIDIRSDIAKKKIGSLVKLTRPRIAILGAEKIR